MALAGCSSSLRVIPQTHIKFIRSSFPSSELKFQKSSQLFHHQQQQKLHVQVQSLNPTSSSSIPATSLTPKWAEFATNVSGEWDGFGADFTCDGKPIELPEMVVPQAYRDWEVKVFDWQTQCPTLAQPNHLLLSYKTIKLLPTVGCEADAATRFSIDERTLVEGDNNKAIAFAYESSGCYVGVWPIGIGDDGKYKDLELEFCLINPKDRESRVRICLNISTTMMMRIASIGVFCEQWYGPFRNGEQLGGCSIRDSAFASTPPLRASEIAGIWEGLSAVASFHNSQTMQGVLIEEVTDDRMIGKTVRDEGEGEVVLLPKQLWCCHKEISKEETCFEVGWLLDPGFALTSRCMFFSNSSKLKAISIARETRIMDGV